jgi:hypothetical protein
MKVTLKERQELSPSSYCLTDPCKTYMIYILLFFGPRKHSTEVKYIKIYLHLHTYRYWTALRLAKEDDISPFRPLKDRFLQNIKWLSFIFTTNLKQMLMSIYHSTLFNFLISFILSQGPVDTSVLSNFFLKEIAKP